MEARKNAAIASSIRVRDMQKNLDFYSKTSGFQAADKLHDKDGKAAQSTVGFDSPLLILSSMWYLGRHQTKDDPRETGLGGCVEFCIGRSGTGKLDAFFAEVKAKGITVINQPGMDS